MKKIFAMLLITGFLISCGSDKKTASIEKAIAAKDINKLKEARIAIQKEYDIIGAQLAQIDAALSELDTVKKVALVTTTTIKDTVFTHYIDIQGNVETKENVIIYPRVFRNIDTSFSHFWTKSNQRPIISQN
jgi:membrane fusion protein, multidrug efflux system